jgi:hypothetical protein
MKEILEATTVVEIVAQTATVTVAKAVIVNLKMTRAWMKTTAGMLAVAARKNTAKICKLTTTAMKMTVIKTLRAHASGREPGNESAYFPLKVMMMNSDHNEHDYVSVFLYLSNRYTIIMLIHFVKHYDQIVLLLRSR